MLEVLLDIDRYLFEGINSNGIPFLDPLFLVLSSTWTNVLVYLSISIVIARNRKWTFFLSLVLVVGVLIAFTDQITNLFKFGIARLRPCHDPELETLVRLVKASCGGMYGFFSGHASNSFALATFFSGLLKKHAYKGSWLLFLLAGLIALSRVYLGVHFPLDILCGSIFGIFSGYVFWKLSTRLGLAYTK
jgi:undecaprenyl-diphosphatase